jgi:hypothetical protein
MGQKEVRNNYESFLFTGEEGGETLMVFFWIVTSQSRPLVPLGTGMTRLTSAKVWVQE